MQALPGRGDGNTGGGRREAEMKRWKMTCECISCKRAPVSTIQIPSSVFACTPCDLLYLLQCTWQHQLQHNQNQLTPHVVPFKSVSVLMMSQETCLLSLFLPTFPNLPLGLGSLHYWCSLLVMGPPTLAGWATTDTSLPTLTLDSGDGTTCDTFTILPVIETVVTPKPY